MIASILNGVIAAAGLICLGILTRTRARQSHTTRGFDPLRGAARYFSVALVFCVVGTLEFFSGAGSAAVAIGASLLNILGLTRLTFGFVRRSAAI